MAARTFCIPGIIFLFCAFVLSLLVSISLPSLPTLDITRVQFNGSPVQASGGVSQIGQLRFGVWAYCVYGADSGDRTCVDPGHGYSVQINSTQANDAVTVASSWTRGLAVHPVATVVIFAALLLSLSTHITLMLLSSIVSFLAALLTAIAFAIDIALFVHVRNQMGHLQGISERTIAGPGFWLTLAAFILLLLAGCTVCLGRRRERMAGATKYPTKTGGFWSRFRRN